MCVMHVQLLHIEYLMIMTIMKCAGGMVEQQRRLEFRRHLVGVDWIVSTEAVAIDGRDAAHRQRHSTISSDVVVVVVIAGNVTQLVDIFVVVGWYHGDADDDHFAPTGPLPY